MGYSLRAAGVRFRNLLKTHLARDFERRHPSAMKTLDEYLKGLEKEDKITKKVDIGLPVVVPKRKSFLKERIKIIQQNKKSSSLEKLARLNQLNVPMDEVYDDWKKSQGCRDIMRIASHYGIFDTLFDHGYFHPIVLMDINYTSDDETYSVYRGNLLYPKMCKTVPSVSFDAEDNTLWTLVCTSLDSHLTDSSQEYLHWMVGNIPNGDVDKGETICNYMQPIPARGTGYHRIAYVLYKQDSHIDYSHMKRESPCRCLKKRTFKTFDFYKSKQDLLTPVGLSFHQSKWDDSLHDFFHDELNMKEPIFEYEHPPHEFKPQVKHPHQMPFNFYLDHYRDPKEINKEVLLERLKKLDPFTPEPPPSEYPQIHWIGREVPTWKQAEIRKKWARVGKYSWI